MNLILQFLSLQFKREHTYIHIAMQNISLISQWVGGFSAYYFDIFFWQYKQTPMKGKTISKNIVSKAMI